MPNRLVSFFKFFVKDGGFGGRPAPCYDDPLSHPALSRMTLVELGDLPFEPADTPCLASRHRADMPFRA